MLGVSAESYRTWDIGRRATPPKMLVRARALATHRDDHELLPLPVLALLIGVHVKTLRAAARDGKRQDHPARRVQFVGRPSLSKNALLRCLAALTRRSKEMTSTYD